jgi:hypothetical protein
MAEQQPSFKSQMKALVRRVVTTGVGFVKVGFQRDMDRICREIKILNIL